MEEIKKKVLEAKEAEKQKQRDKLEKIQLEYFTKLQKNENEIILKNIKEADEKKALEEKIKKDKIEEEKREKEKTEKVQRKNIQPQTSRKSMKENWQKN